MPLDVAIARHFDVDELFSPEELGSLQAAAPLPLYHQLHGILKARILSGRLARGDVLPGEAKMADAWQVSRVTVQKALRMLTAEELIRRQRGIGSYVVYRHAKHDSAGPDCSAPRRDEEKTGATGHARVLETKWMSPADSPLADVRMADPRRAVLYVCSVSAPTPRSPATLCESWVLSLDAETVALDLAQQSSKAQLRRLDLAADRARRRISVEPASARSAELLTLPPGNPVMTVSDLYFDRQHTPVGLVESRYNPLGFQFDFCVR